MSPRSFVGLLALLLAVVIGAQSVYIITEIERAVLLRFGKVANPDVGTGLHFKVPFVDQVRSFDARIMALDALPERFLTLEKKSMQVDSYAKWRIINVQRYYTATNGEQDRAERIIAQRINSGLRDEFARRSLQEVISGERDQLMLDLKNELNSFSEASMGIEVVDVRVKRIDLPDEVRETVFTRMRSEREREAKELRAVGREQAEITRAEADREVVVIESNAYRESEIIRGDGDALAAATFGQAFNQDVEFYGFMRSLRAYRETFAGKEDLIILDPSNEFFRYFKDRAPE